RSCSSVRRRCKSESVPVVRGADDTGSEASAGSATTASSSSSAASRPAPRANASSDSGSPSADESKSGFLRCAIGGREEQSNETEPHSRGGALHDLVNVRWTGDQVQRACPIGLPLRQQPLPQHLHRPLRRGCCLNGSPM